MDVKKGVIIGSPLRIAMVGMMKRLESTSDIRLKKWADYKHLIIFPGYPPFR
jgi:hypothetical protein